QNYGRVGAGMNVSGLEEEFDLSRDLPRLMYVKAPAPDRDLRLTELLSRVKQQTSYKTFGTAAELDQLVQDDLATLLGERLAAARPEKPGTERGLRPLPEFRPLPVGATSLVGRQAAIEELCAIVGQADARLVTPPGPGGVGKTRLAIAVG